MPKASPQATSRPAAKIAIRGAETLLGRELAEILASRPLAELVRADQAALVLHAGDDTEKGPRAAASATIIDLTGTLGAGVLRAPAVEPERYLAPEGKLITVAHPAAILIAMFLRRLSPIAEIRHAVMAIYEPASQRGQAALEELQEQTIALLNLRPLPQDVFGDQASFNMLPRLGDGIAPSIEEAQRRIESDLAAILGWGIAAPMPSLRLVQSPVFHGYTISAWVEFAAPPDLRAMTVLLKAAGVDIRTLDEGAPVNSAIAGQSGIALDVIRPDSQRPNAAWFWIAGDNLRIAAENALLAGAAILEQAGRGIQ